jgi:hypothetical protein
MAWHARSIFTVKKVDARPLWLTATWTTVLGQQPIRTCACAYSVAQSVGARLAWHRAPSLQLHNSITDGPLVVNALLGYPCDAASPPRQCPQPRRTPLPLRCPLLPPLFLHWEPSRQSAKRHLRIPQAGADTMVSSPRMPRHTPPRATPEQVAAGVGLSVSCLTTLHCTLPTTGWEHSYPSQHGCDCEC